MSCSWCERSSWSPKKKNGVGAGGGDCAGDPEGLRPMGRARKQAVTILNVTEASAGCDDALDALIATRDKQVNRGYRIVFAQGEHIAE